MTHTFTVTADSAEELRGHILGPDAFSVLRTLDENLRAAAKYESGLARPGDLTPEAAALVRGHLHSLLEDACIGLIA